MEQTLNSYKCYYKNKVVDIYAETALKAQQAAAIHFKAKKPHNISVFLDKEGSNKTPDLL